MLVLDRAHSDHMTGADRAQQIEVLALFRMHVEGWSAAMASASGWREAVHTLKGSARGIGLNALAAACEAAETSEDSEAGLHGVRVALNEALEALEQFAAEAA